METVFFHPPPATRYLPVLDKPAGIAFNPWGRGLRGERGICGCWFLPGALYLSPFTFSL
jgi:hypothetical protein